jgi:hypothetical protein
VKSLITLWSCTADELAVRCCTSATRDKITVASRVEHEGLGFLAISLADFGKATQRWLSLGRVEPSDVPSFAKSSGRLNGLPKFMSGFLARVFDPCDGVLLDDYDIEAITAVRQLTLGFSKIALPSGSQLGTRTRVVTPEREKRAMLDFIQCESDVKESDSIRTAKMYADFCRVSDLLYAEAFSRVDEVVHNQELMPKHGPGATADKLTSNGKWNQRTWTTRLESVFPFLEYALPSHSYYSEMDGVDIREPEAEVPVRVTAVPKTLKTPRIIAIEPTCMQYAQQAVLREVLKFLGEDDILSKMIGFSDQTPNRDMARQGSLCGDLATLDLSEASDRVSNQLVRAMLRNHPHLLSLVDACRSRKAEVPGHGVIRLAKFASMGSALCFPFEAMVFLTLILLGIEDELNTSLSRKEVFNLIGKVRVYGDDIIAPVRHVRTVVQRLESFGIRVNLSKSFWTGKFRESCGREYYDGQDVSIVKVRAVLPTQRQDASGVISMVALRNQFYLAGYWGTCRWLDSYVRKVIKHFPDIEPTAPLLGRVSFLGYKAERQHPSLHSPLVKGWFVQAEPPSDVLEGPGALLKCFLKLDALHSADKSEPLERDSMALSGVPTLDKKHLERSGRPKCVSIKLGWRSPW